ncbi:MAG: tetratricopeptide repeat protein [Bradymonadia bacterium]
MRVPSIITVGLWVGLWTLTAHAGDPPDPAHHDHHSHHAHLHGPTDIAGPDLAGSDLHIDHTPPLVPHRAWKARKPGSQPVYYVRAMGPVAESHTHFACEVIREVFNIKCFVMPAFPLMGRAYDLDRNQYDADQLIDGLFDGIPDNAVGLMGLTNADLFENGSGRFVFGLASVVDRVGVVSLARYRGHWWDNPSDPVRFHELMYKVVVHEVGHTLGIQEHCPDTRCAMREDRTLEDLVESPSRLCHRCRSRVKQGLRQTPGSAASHYLRGHSMLNRGRVKAAIHHFERAVQLFPNDARFQNDLGVAYLKKGDRARALLSFREAARLNPQFPNPRFNESLIFASVGDVDKARHALELALIADPDWALAHKHLGQLYLDAFGDPDRAALHFERYLAAAGDDPLIADHLRVIKGGGER